MNDRFKDQVVLVTGAASGLGAAVAKQVSDEGGSVVLVDVDREGLETVAATLPTATLALEGDVSNPASVADVFRTAIDQFGYISAVHANAGIAGPLGGIDEIDPTDLDRVLGVNVRGAFLCVQEAAKAILGPGRTGSVLLTSSALGLMGAQGAAPYAVSKHAVIGLARCAGLEFGSRGMRVNALCPGYIDTPLMRGTEAVVGGGDIALGRKTLEAGIGYGRYARVEEVASLACWLLGPESTYANGGAFSVDGGMAAGLDVGDQSA